MEKDFARCIDSNQDVSYVLPGAKDIWGQLAVIAGQVKISKILLPSLLCTQEILRCDPSQEAAQSPLLG
jgi:hypothetical protein